MKQKDHLCVNSSIKNRYIADIILSTIVCVSLWHAVLAPYGVQYPNQLIDEKNKFKQYSMYEYKKSTQNNIRSIFDKLQQLVNISYHDIYLTYQVYQN